MAKKFTELANGSTPKYFHLLDITRGFAALAVVVWHWQHFYTGKDGVFSSRFQIDAQPFYSLFYVFYNYGVMAVDLFFLISGFVFFYLYSGSVADEKISAKTFAALRFSRLYPLQFVTLFVVLILQSIFYHSNGYYFVYPFNDAYHFILNLFFASSWGLEKGTSFNGPNWSVSVEILLYCLFFLFCRYRIKKFGIWLLMLCGLAIQVLYPPIGHGLLSFFLGSLSYYVYTGIIQHNRQRSYLKVLRIISLLYAVFILIDVKYGFAEKGVIAGMQYLPVHLSDASAALKHINNLLVRLFVFPVFLLYLVLLETVKGPRGRKLSFVGNISYSSYLLHFPLQLIVMLCCGQWMADRIAFFNSGYTFLLFFAVLVIISLLSYYFFELPVQRYLRRRLIKSKVSIA